MLRRSSALLFTTHRTRNWSEGAERRAREFQSYDANLMYEELAERMGLPVEYVEDLATPKFRHGKVYPAMKGRLSKPNELSSQFDKMFPRYREAPTVRKMRVLKMSDLSSD